MSCFHNIKIGRQQVKLSDRLGTIQSIAEQYHKQFEYDYIWDTCCDHGQLGAALLKNGISSQLFFVDIVPELVANVELNLKQYFPNQTNQWHTLCEDVSSLPLDKAANINGKMAVSSKAADDVRHLIIIAGIGGDLMLEFITQLNQRFPDLALDFLLCPVHHQFALRKQLKEMEFRLRHEVVLEENNRFYEVLLVTNDVKPKGTKHTKFMNSEGEFVTTGSSSQPKRIDVAGEALWFYKTENEKSILERYLTKTLTHYRRMQKGNNEFANTAIAAYERVKIENGS